jgi:hypothetical protein
MLDAGCFPYRSSISIDMLLKPLLVTVSEETESSASILLRGKKMCREGAGGDLGHAEEEDRTLQLQACEIEGDAVELGCQGTATADATTNAGVTAEARPARTKEAGAEEVVATEVVAPRIATDKVAACETTATEASPGLAGQEEACEVTEEAMKETPAGTETLEPPEVVA